MSIERKSKFQLVKIRTLRWCKDCGAINAIEHLGRDLAWFRCKCLNKKVGD